MPMPPRQVVIGHDVLDEKNIRRRRERAEKQMRRAGIDPHQPYDVKQDLQARKVIVEQG